LGMVKDPNVFPFDNDMKEAYFGTKLCSWIFFLSSYIALSNWIWKIYHIDIILRPKLCQFVQFEISPSMSHKVFIFLKITHLLFALLWHIYNTNSGKVLIDIHTYMWSKQQIQH
jgi:hypothetical protein